MTDRDWLAARYEEQRPRLRGVAYRMLGSLTEADDALQEAWLRMSRADAEGVDNLAGWMTTIVARVCLNILRSRRRRPDDSLSVHLPDPVVDPPSAMDPEHEVLLADAVGMALMVLLDSLTPAERIAFVLHDTMGVPFDDIAAMIGRSPAAARQLASRARRRVKAQAISPDPDLTEQRKVVDAFSRAVRSGDVEALAEVLAPDVVVNVDWGKVPGRPSRMLGAKSVARGAIAFANSVVGEPRAALVNGAAGVVIVDGGRAVAIMAFTVSRGRIAEIDIVRDPDQLIRAFPSADTR
jgi:RNA polymerase sigma factor (sigma-70 family)